MGLSGFFFLLVLLSIFGFDLDVDIVVWFFVYMFFFFIICFGHWFFIIITVQLISIFFIEYIWYLKGLDLFPNPFQHPHNVTMDLFGRRSNIGVLFNL